MVRRPGDRLDYCWFYRKRQRLCLNDRIGDLRRRDDVGRWIFQLVHAFSARGWKRRALNILSALFYGVAGVVIVYDPVLSAVDISLVIGALLVAAGIVRFITALRDRSHNGWGWVAASGVATVIVGILVLATWPAVGLWLLGMMLAVDLIFQGWGFLAFGFALKGNAPAA